MTLQDGKVVKQEILHIPVSETMGMLFVGNALYINGSGKRGFGLYRCKDTKGDDSYDDVEILREWPGAAASTGPMGWCLGPDKMLYAVCGNFTAVPKDLAPTSPHRSYADDLALNRMEDGNGFGAGQSRRAATSPAWTWRARTSNCSRPASATPTTSPSTPTANCSASTATWNGTGARPGTGRSTSFIRVRGGENGFREGSAKWPEYYADSLPHTVDDRHRLPDRRGLRHRRQVSR